MMILKAYRHPIPAIPPLFACIGVFLGLGFVITGNVTAYYVGAVLILAGTVAMLADIVTVASRMHTEIRNRKAKN
jgi:hypothetical protein